MLATIKNDNLVDIRTVSVDKNLPQAARIAEFIRQIKDPSHYKCGRFNITAVYANDGVTLEDCLRGMLN